MPYDRRQNKQRNRSQRDLGSELERLMETIQTKKGISFQHKNPLKEAWYKFVTPQLAAHISNVIRDQKNQRILVVYVDEPIYITELEMQKEQYRQLLSDELGQVIEELRFRLARQER